MTRGARAFGVALLLASSAQAAVAAAATDELAAGFADPPASARPRTWWHWLNGNISEDGIVKDLAWMKSVGLGGVQTFDASLMTPQVVKDRLAFMTPGWKKAFRLAARTADRLGLELAIAGSPGWSETGGPWVAPRDGMKKLVWSETDVEGGRPLHVRLAAPPSTTGPFQTLPFDDPLAAFEGKSHVPPGFYADVAVLAYPINPAPAGAAPRVEGGSAADAAALADDSVETAATLTQRSEDGSPTLTLVYPDAVTIRSATLFIAHALPAFGDPRYTPVLEAETARGWTRLAVLPLSGVPTTVSFPGISARRFRLVLGPNIDPKRVALGAPAPGVVMEGLFPPQKASDRIAVAQLRLSDQARVDRFEAKAGFATVSDYYSLSRGLPDAAGIDPARLVDVTAHVGPDGTLDWMPPAGRWRILRLGSTLLGTTNHPATPEATGLEVDKYDGAAVARYMDRYIAMYRDAAGADMLGAHGVRAIVTDSFEAGDANWTPQMLAQFRRLRGYDPVPWLPALTGAIIGSRARSDAFLYDYRRTLADLLASEHYGTIAGIAHRNGLSVYGEALEDSRPALGDDIAMRRHADVPMAALWTYPREGAPRPTLTGDMRGAASVAHIYGKPVVAAESFTSAFAPWAFAPADLRHVADMEFVSGINRPVIHTSVHQPADDKVPGLSLAIFGQYFNRHETWAGMARPWIDYLSRTGFLLQQGRDAADLAWFMGEEAPLTAQTEQAPLTHVPVRYGYDALDADALIGALRVERGNLVTTGGARYRALFLGGSSSHMTLPVLKRVAALAEQGATVIGTAPLSSPALDDDTVAFAALVRHLWSGAAVTPVGAGRVIAAAAPEEGLHAVGIGPDFDAEGVADGTLRFAHRHIPGGDIYFVVNTSAAPRRVEARFRVEGRAPALWHADTGRIEPISYRAGQGITTIPLDLGAGESVFVVFRGPLAAAARTVAIRPERAVATLMGPWTATFQPGRGAPATKRMETLTALDRSEDPRIRFFSGVTSYRTHLTLPALPGGRLILDLGAVGDVADVRVNGRTVGYAWHAPYRVDLSGALRPGKNDVEVRVANLWVNRLIGDAQPGAAKIGWTSMPTYRADAPLRPSGLIGPVRITTMPGAR